MALFPSANLANFPLKQSVGTINLEYGTDSLEMHKDAFKPGSQVIVLDDVLATGGTLEAAIGLCADGGAEVLRRLCH